ncbi:MAG TPA: hypothetical protein VGU25_13515 [Acidobacteriaceae bacterium]|nr:hypothetical protein [Acidobacteriaceae bacterium]
MQTVSAREERAKGSTHHATNVANAWKYLAGFVGVFLLLFLASNRRVVVYDEGILLTGVMRVMAGQVPHRDFYYNYGPATVYLIAGLFKLFGPSVLVERLLALFADSLLVVTLYAMTRRLCKPKVATVAGCYGLLWMFGLGAWSLLAVVMLWATWLLRKVFQSDLPAIRAFAAGALVGVATLLRYDMGAGILACHVLTIGVASYLRRDSLRSRAVSMARSLWGYVLGLAVVVAPPAWAYLRVAPVHDLLFDIVLYTAHHYHAARALPFPWRHLAQLQDLVVYVLVVLMAISVYVAARYMIAFRKRERVQTDVIPEWIAVLIPFLFIALMAYAKGVVRLGAAGEALAAMPCIVMTAVLYEHREIFSEGLRKTLRVMIVLLWIFAGWGALHAVSGLHKFKSSMLLWMIEPAKMDPQPPFDGWCRDRNPVTRGVCYSMDSDHIQTVEFLEAHTKPGDTLFVGLPQHDRIFINDNMTYFATQRLPATKWSHFDPFLQNTAPIQQEMVAELERNKPPYVVLDSEFDAVHEPNGSSVHTGVHLLDNYIAQHYQWVKTFGEMTILQRRAG